jgi:membrane associated rhomboid family serine protease
VKEDLRIVAMKYFGWWFAWGCFSGILVFIPIKGGGFALETQVFGILALGVLSGSASLLYYIKKKIRKKERKTTDAD